MEILLVIFSALTRIVPHPYNFTAIGAIALFSGANLNRKNYWIPFLALFLTDTYLGFHNTMVYVYGSFALIIAVGYFIRKKQNIITLTGASILSSIIFFIVTNFGVWQLWGSLYPHTWQGLIACYIAGIPFFKNTLLGDLIYTALIFGAYNYSIIKLKLLSVILNTKMLDKNILQ